MFEYIVSGVCYINRNIRHNILPYIKNEYFPEWQEMAFQIFKVIKMSQGIYH